MENENLTTSWKSRAIELTKHPIVLLVLGFLLTDMIGTRISENIQSQKEVVREIEIQQQLRLESISEITELFYERYTLSSLLASSIKRDFSSLDELVDRKREYDETYKKWNTKLQAIQLRIREISNSKDYSEIESFVQYGLIPHFTKLDELLTEDYDCKTTGKKCNYDPQLVRNELDKCLACSYSISNFLWTMTRFEKDRKLIEDARRSLYERCPK